MAKKKLTKQEEFDIMKLVLDKFLWLGIIIMALGIYEMSKTGEVLKGLSIIIAGAVVLVLFMIIMIKEYEFLRY